MKFLFILSIIFGGSMMYSFINNEDKEYQSIKINDPTTEYFFFVLYPEKDNLPYISF